MQSNIIRDIVERVRLVTLYADIDEVEKNVRRILKEVDVNKNNINVFLSALTIKSYGARAVTTEVKDTVLTYFITDSKKGTITFNINIGGNND